MARIVGLVLAGVGGAFVYAAFLKGLPSVPAPGPATYYLTVAFIAFVKASLFVSASAAE